ncbi:MAG: amidohydrolase [Clostridiales bacterium]|nr:amidohydrolase [Clostridiales bacterium]MDY5514316.1 amidohydrolase [Candidatus Ventricola sp.]
MSALLLRGGMVYDAVHSEPFDADILCEDGKIAAIGLGLSVPDGCEIVDVSGLRVYPGFVEAHGHIGLDGYGIGYEGQDYNEYGDILTPQLRAIDGIKPGDYAFAEAAAAGVTCVCTGPGSSNVLGGTFAAIKTTGRRVEEMLVRADVAMKCAFGENPKRCYREKGNSSRMSTAAKLREMLFKAKEYDRKLRAAGDDESKLPPFDMKLNALLPVIRGEIPLKAHAHQADDMFTAIRIAKEFGVRLTLEHCTEGHLVADLLAAEHIPMAVGPTFGNASKYELRKKTWETPAILDKAGCTISIITDAPVTPLKYLPLCAGFAVHAGLDPFHALQAITINPAKHIGIQERVGSIEVGKDADLVVMDGSCFEISTSVAHVYINGVAQPVNVHFEEA